MRNAQWRSGIDSRGLWSGLMRDSEFSIGKSGNPVDSWARAKPQRGHWMIGYHSHPECRRCRQGRDGIGIPDAKCAKPSGRFSEIRVWQTSRYPRPGLYITHRELSGGREFHPDVPIHTYVNEAEPFAALRATIHAWLGNYRARSEGI